jgi:AmmeMemoRadiSam system protein B
MLRFPAVAGKFYPAQAAELSSLVAQCARPDEARPPEKYTACLVPHAGYLYSGHVAGEVFSRVLFPKRILLLGVRHFPYGEECAVLREGAWRTPLGDAPVDSALAEQILLACPALREDPIAHESEHSLEVQLPFLQVLSPGFRFVPIALGTHDYRVLLSVGQGLGKVMAADPEVFLLTTSDFNHYESDAVTRKKDQLAIDRILALDPRGLFDVCRKHNVSMCGLGPTVSLLTALQALGASRPELVRHATSADVSGDKSSVVGYGGFVFR